MKRTLRYRDNNTESLNIWPSFTDLMANAFMIISLFLLLALFKSLFLKYTAEETELDLTDSERQVRILKRKLAVLNGKLGESIDTVRRLEKSSSELQNLLQRSNSKVKILNSEVNVLNSEVNVLNSEVNVLELENQQLKSAPPVVVIQDSGEYRFASGSATLPNKLKNYIANDLVKRIEEISKQRNLYVVEIIGHTDGQVIFNRTSNLDKNLEAVAQGNKSINTLIPGSNTDLGLMRALEVVKQLQLAQKKGRLEGVQFRAYSAAQLQLPSGDFASADRNSDAKRRRIEIRFSPLGKAETIR